MKKSAVYSGICGISACVFLFSTGMTYASWKVQDDTVNKITMGSVRGQVVEEFEQDTVVYPDADVTKIVQVKNTGTIDAIPRVKIEKVWGDSRDENGILLINPDLSAENIEIEYNTKDWTYNTDDGYFYYNGVLSPGETTNSLFDSFRINGDISGYEYRNKYADIIVSMEIIQAAGDSLSYWDMSYEDLGITYKQEESESVTTSVTFRDPDKGFTFDVNGGDLFADFKNLIPGESRSQTVEIDNVWDNDVDIYFWADFIEQEDADERTEELVYQLLHKYANIIITDENGDLIYEGPIWGSPDVNSHDTDSMKFPYYLGNFLKGSTKKVNVGLYLSPEMDNEYLDLLGLIKWVFSAEGSSSTGGTTSSEPDLTSSAPTTSESDLTSSTPTTSEPDLTSSIPTTSEPDLTSSAPTTSEPDLTSSTPTTSESDLTSSTSTSSETNQTNSTPTTSGSSQTTPTTSETDHSTKTPTSSESSKTNSTPTTSDPGKSNSTSTTQTTTTSKTVQTTPTPGNNSTTTRTVTEYAPPDTGGYFNVKLHMLLAICSLILMIFSFKKSKEK